MGTAHMEVPLELFAIEVSIVDDPYDRWIDRSRVYPTRPAAEHAMALLEARARVKEQEDWDEQPCMCGNRKCDQRSNLFPNFSIYVLTLVS